jgi:nitroreductase
MSVPKPAETQYPIHELIRDRWSPRAFSDRPVEKEALLSLLEAARWSASSYNYQPWSFIVATKDNPEEYNRLLSVLVEFNQGWAKSAPVLILAVAQLINDEGKENRYAFHDVGLALGNLSLQATALGLSLHQAAGFDRDKARTEFQIPEGYAPATALVIGYAGDPQSLPEGLREKELAPRERKPLQDFVFSGQFNNVSPLLNA